MQGQTATSLFQYCEFQDGRHRHAIIFRQRFDARSQQAKVRVLAVGRP